MTDRWAIRILQVTSTSVPAGPAGRNPTAAAQAVADAEDSRSYPRMPNNDVLHRLLEGGLRKHLNHDMRSLKSWIRAKQHLKHHMRPLRIR